MKDKYFKKLTNIILLSQIGSEILYYSENFVNITKLVNEYVEHNLEQMRT